MTKEEEILKSNQENFLKKFDIVDDNSSNVSFNLEQQLFLDEYLNQVIEIFNSYESDNFGVNPATIEELKTDAENLKKRITKDTKKIVIGKLTRLWAKAQVVGLQVIQDIFIKYVTELTARLLTGP